MDCNAIERPEEWFKFTLIRDPIKRFLSFYSGKILDQNIDGNHTFLNYDRFGFLPNMSMDQVIDVLVSKRFETEPHLHPQAQWIRATNFRLDFVGQLEKLSRCVSDIHSLTGIELTPEHLNSSKQKPVVPSREQFNLLAKFYAEDIATFGYINSYDEWLQTHVAGKESRYQLEPGFTFSGEAKLLNHSLTRTDRGFEIDLNWRLDAHHHRKRVVRIIARNNNGFELIWHLPPKLNLSEPVQSGQIINDQISIPFDRLPANINLVNVYHELYFSDNDMVRAPLVDYAAHDNMLLFPFGHLAGARKQAA